MVFGVGTDYAIFLISRYREELGHDGNWHEAARTTVKRIGAVITASAGTVIVGMMAMGAGDFKMITSMGPGIAIAVAITLGAALTLSPALLSIFGHYLFWPLHTKVKREEGEPRGFFASLANAVSRRPVVVTVALTALLALPILYLPQVHSNFDVMADLPADADSRIGYQQIGEHLGEDKLVQSTALIELGGDGDVLAPAQLARLYALMVTLHDSGGTATATSIVTPEGDISVPDGFRPSGTLQEMADGFAGDDGEAQATDTSSLLDPEVLDGLNQTLDYVNGLAVAFPDVAAGAAVARGPRRDPGRDRRHRAGPGPERRHDPAPDPVLVDHRPGQRRLGRLGHGRRRRRHADERLPRGAGRRVPRGPRPRRVPGRRPRRPAAARTTPSIADALALSDAFDRLADHVRGAGPGRDAVAREPRQHRRAPASSGARPRPRSTRSPTGSRRCRPCSPPARTTSTSRRR